MKRLFFALCFALLISGLVHADDPAGITSVTLAKTSSSWDGAPLPSYPKDRPEITILRITIPEGTNLPQHTHPVINAGVLLRGELTVVTRDDKKLLLKAGDPIVEVVDTWHYGKNTGKGPAEIIVFYAGSPSTPITVKE
jgi:quercetin dioxygenase-like cupin family protein